MDGRRHKRRMALILVIAICCAALLAPSCAPLSGLLNWQSAPSETDDYAVPRKRVPLPPTVQDFEDAASPPGPDAQ
jgi:hypothetical protein